MSEHAVWICTRCDRYVADDPPRQKMMCRAHRGEKVEMRRVVIRSQAVVDQVQQQADDLADELVRTRSTLAFYADRLNYAIDARRRLGGSRIRTDRGRRARAELERRAA